MIQQLINPTESSGMGMVPESCTKSRGQGFYTLAPSIEGISMYD